MISFFLNLIFYAVIFYLLYRRFKLVKTVFFFVFDKLKYFWFKYKPKGLNKSKE